MNIRYKKSIWSLDVEQAIKDLNQLELGENCFYPESDYGHGYILKGELGFECWSIPLYGGDPSLEETCETAEEAFAVCSSWT
jgi:hypothetical protein